MRREAKHKGLAIPNYFQRWINIKKVFPTHLFDKEAPPNIVEVIDDKKKAVTGGMPDMLKRCMIEMQGRHHSGIDDAKNIASIVIACLERGFEFHQGHVLSKPILE